MLLQGKNGVVFGVANKRSIAAACARQASAAGAKLVLTYQNERLREGTEKLAAALPGEAVAVECDVGDDANMATAFEQIGEHFGGKVDFGVHSIAFADRQELEGRFTDTSREGWRNAMDISAWSMLAVSKGLEPFMTEGGSMVTMSYLGAQQVMPNYNLMGAAKAALESSVRYLASELGPAQIRVNAISAGPIRTLAASGVSGFSAILEVAKERNPLRRNTTADEVGDTAVFLASDMSSAITGTVVWCDCGFHVMAI